MSISFELSIEISEQYDFTYESLTKNIEQNTWVKNQWPLVYFIQNESLKPKRIAYIGESTNASKRIKNHLANPKRQALNKISIIGSDKFNKSATLDIESNLIQYITAEGTYELQNGNYGLINHKYYQQDLYTNLFKEIWTKLLEKRVVSKSLSEIRNSELFKYSPYKSLNPDQYNSVLDILKGLTIKKSNKIFISGSAGTGKTILAAYLIKLLSTNLGDVDIDDLTEDELFEVNFVKEFQKIYPNKKIGLVIAMTSLRQSLQNVFRKTPGLKPSMVISPSDSFSQDKYDLLIVDESHRLRQYKNIGWRGVFKKNNKKLGLNDNGNELDWIIANSKNQIFFYDSAQSVKPSDIESSNFYNLINDPKTLNFELKSQMRVEGGNNYIEFVDELLNIKRGKKPKYNNDGYDLKIFESFTDFYSGMQKKEADFKLCRIVAGYAWEWKSDPKRKESTPDAIDIEIDNLQFQWNQTDKDWINNPKDPENPLKEIGCIHTVQGYDLNYTGVIFGSEIDYNPNTNQIEIDSTKYYDKYGRLGTNEEELKRYIVNIYKTIMYRGIKGTFIYACNTELREYLKIHVTTFKKEIPFRIIKKEDVIPYVNSIPLVDISAAAGNFSDLQSHSEYTWIELPLNISVREGYFVCKVVGESMNKIIPNGSYCLFKKDEGGSRNGEIVLVESTNIQDSEFGSGYTVKEYHSNKTISDDEWRHESITLKPVSSNIGYKEINLSDDELIHFKIIGIFEKVLI